MKVAEITCQHLLSGIGRYGWELASGMQEKGVLSTLYKPFKSGHPDEVYHRKDWVHGYSYRSLRDLHPYLLPWFIKKGVNFTKSEILHAHWFLSGLAISSFKKNPKIITMHDVSLLHLPEKGSRYISYYAKSIERFKKLEIPLIVVSENAKKDTIRYAAYPEHLVHVVHNGINHEQFFPEQNGIKRPTNTYRFIYSGGLGARKNVSLLLRAFKRIESKFDVELVISGAHPERTAYPELVKELKLNRVVFTGFIEDDKMADFYRAGHTMVFPSEYEGFGLAPLESMACGTPVLSAKGGALQETSGNGALYFEYDEEDLAVKMIQVLENRSLREELTQKGLQQASRYSWEKTVDRTLEIYRRIS